MLSSLATPSALSAESENAAQKYSDLEALQFLVIHRSTDKKDVRHGDSFRNRRHLNLKSFSTYTWQFFLRNFLRLYV